MSRLHFTLGPVQGFVEQSRRTRDLWASSWLLSWLSGQAMQAVMHIARGTVLELPVLDEAQLVDLLHRRHAALPNRFVARVDDGSIAGREATEAVHRAWKRVADAVWKEFIEPIADHGEATDLIWQRQIGSFWEIAWAVGEADDLLARRKLWRSPSVTIEPGDHCALMPQWQELSGHIGSANRAAREQQKFFWEIFRKHSRLNELDFDSREQLCACALVKRLFPQLPEKIQREIFGFAHDTSQWPATTSLAAEPWQREIFENSKFQISASNYARKVHAANSSAAQDFEKLHGNYLLESALGNSNGTPLRDESLRLDLLKELQELYRKAESAPSPHYAIVLADGDRMGACLGVARERGKLNDFTRALVDFAKNAPNVVRDSDAHCVYAGGDDVLALSSVSQALVCAERLEKSFSEAFKGHEGKPTLSIAVLFVHYRLPFSDAIKSAHHLLDNIAKERTGRHSLAVALHKHSGVAAQFSAPWPWWRQIVKGKELWETFSTLVDPVRSEEDEAATEPKLTRHYLYKVRSLIERFHQPEESAKPRTAGDVTVLSEDVARVLPDLLIAELLVGRRIPDEESRRAWYRKTARERVEELLKYCHPVHRDANGTVRDAEKKAFSLDGPLLALFLSGAGKEIA